MAYMNQERKSKIAANLKAVMPAGWKWSLAVRNHSTIVLTIASAPADLLGEMQRCMDKAYPHDRGRAVGDHVGVNPYYIERQFDEHLDLFKKILAAMNDGNHDRSDIQTDYFDVGWYVDINLGRWDKGFVCTAKKVDVQAAGRAIAAACIARGLPADRLAVLTVGHLG